MSEFRERVLAVVKQIPAGKVATYGQVAMLVDTPRAARAVGGILSGLKFADPPPTDIPWQRVLNASGAISAQGDTHRLHIQRAMLESEGVVFDARGQCDLRVFRWLPEP